MYKKIIFNNLYALIILILVSCGNQNSSNSEDEMLPYSPTGKYAIIVSTAPDYSSGAHSVLGYSAPRSSANNLLPTGSDLWISAFNKNFYRIEAYGTNTVTKFSMQNPVKPVWEFSTEGTENNSNPHQIVFVNENKAYLIRYGSPKVWIINPSALVESELKTGELDLSAYNDSDGCPEPASAIIVDDMLFIVMQRLSPSGGFPMAPVNDTYVAVFDINTDIEIDTDPFLGGLKGIKLDVRNPFAKIKHYGNYLYVAGADGTLSNTNNPIKGGVQKINLNTLKAEAGIIAPTTQITGLEIISDTQGYFIQYDDWNNCSLKRFNPQTGYIYPNNVAGIGNSGTKNLQAIIKDDDDLLWLADWSYIDGGMYVIDTATDTIQEGPLDIGLSPMDVVFCER
ncbi:MAG TPA: hypothetical protein PK443_03965 [bacterium]|nr:hypothetical protein [bacterium]